MSEEIFKTEKEFLTANGFYEQPEGLLKLLSNYSLHLLSICDHIQSEETFECALCKREKPISSRTYKRPNVCEKCTIEGLLQQIWRIESSPICTVKYLSDEDITVSERAPENMLERIVVLCQALRAIQEYQMNYVELARSSKIYQIADKALNRYGKP